MPFTPYHFGPNGCVGLLLRRWTDLPVLLLANVAVDAEVLLIRCLGLGWPVHRYCHTLVGGALVGGLCGVGAYLLRRQLAALMRLFRLSYEPTWAKMVISGVLGAWLHVLVDGMYHPDVRLLWPLRSFSLWRIAHNHITRSRIADGCVLLILLAGVLYGLEMLRRARTAPPLTDSYKH